MASTNSRKRSKGRLWFVLHGWFALPVWGGLLLICITGTIATVSQEITWLYDPAVRADSTHGPINFNRIEETVKREYPDTRIGSIKIIEPYFSLHVRLREANNEQRTILVDPYSGNLKGELTSSGLRGIILPLHGWLFIPWQGNYNIGWYIVTFFAIPLLGSLITALVITKNFWRLFIKPRVRFNKGARLFWSDVHRQIGIWSIWFASVICITGLWFLVQGVLTQNHVSLHPTPPVDSSDIKYEHYLPVQTYINNALDIYPDLDVTYVSFPDNENQPVTVMGKRDGSIYRDNINAVYLAADSGSVVSYNSPVTTSFLKKINAIMMPLHFGDFAGLTFKLIWFFFGCMFCFLIGSGFVIWTKRTIKSTRDIILSLKNSRASDVKKHQNIAMNILSWRGFFLLSWIIVLPPSIFLILLFVSD
jgi:uncharacterized iron-regulated membrane protein